MGGVTVGYLFLFSFFRVEYPKNVNVCVPE